MLPVLSLSVVLLSLAHLHCGSSSDTASFPTDSDSGTDGSVNPDGSAGQGGASGQGGAAGQAGSSGQAGSAGSAGSLEGFKAALASDGFTVQEGKFEPTDLSTCCNDGKSCFGNNPTSPYATFRVPAAPGQTVGNPGADAQGASTVYRLRADEAIVYLGTTPPKARYFGFTPYLFDRDDGNGGRRNVFASLSETLNNGVILVDPSGPDPFNHATVVIAAADQGIDGRVRSALTSAGWPSTSINSIVFDPTKGHFGIEQNADTFSVLFRAAVFDQPAEGKAYIENLPGTVLRLTPNQTAAADPFPSPSARAKDTTHTEEAYKDAADALGQALLAAFPGFDGKHMVVSEGTPDPDACIQGTSSCAGDNRDTVYPATIPQPLFESPDEFFVVYGVNHAAVGKASYSNASVYAMEHLVGVGSVTSRQYEGSAATYLPNHPDVAKLYAWKIARDCTGDPQCLAIADAGCPQGVGAGKSGAIAFRVYLEPTTNTGPDPATLIRDRVIRFTKK